MGHSSLLLEQIWPSSPSLAVGISEWRHHAGSCQLCHLLSSLECFGSTLKEIKRVCEQLASIGSPVSEQMKIFALRVWFQGWQDLLIGWTAMVLILKLHLTWLSMLQDQTPLVTGHHALKCWHRFNNSYQDEDLPAALAILRITDVTDQSGGEWVGDSGSTAHITNAPHKLSQTQL